MRMRWQPSSFPRVIQGSILICSEVQSNDAPASSRNMDKTENLPRKKARVSGLVPPGPKGSMVLGVMPEFNRDSLGFITRCRDYGDVVRTRFFYVTAYFLYNPDDIEFVISTNAKNFVKSMSLRSNFFQRLVGNGLVTSEGEFWRRQRRLAQPAFHRERVASYAQVMVDYTKRLTAKWIEGENRDVHPDMMRLTLEIVVQCLFSAEVS